MWVKQELQSEPKPVVILCAGEGRRLEDLGKSIPKAMVKVNNRPLISYVINYWHRFAEEFIFVVGYKKEQIISFVEDTKLSVPTTFVEQTDPRGIAHAIDCAKDHIEDDFAVVLGDCLCRGDFIFPDSFNQGVGVWETENEENIKQSYSVSIEHDLVKKVVEKPKKAENKLCGMGYYFFNKKVFDYIKTTPPSKLRDEVEITDVIQKMAKGGEEIAPLYFKGSYINIGAKEDILKAEQLFAGA